MMSTYLRLIQDLQLKFTYFRFGDEVSGLRPIYSYEIEVYSLVTYAHMVHIIEQAVVNGFVPSGMPVLISLRI